MLAKAENSRHASIESVLGLDADNGAGLTLQEEPCVTITTVEVSYMVVYLTGYPNPTRLSECPVRVHLMPASTNISALISPVYAPKPFLKPTS